MFRKSIFIAAHELGNRAFYPTYQKLVRDQWKTYDDLKCEQEKQLRHLIQFSYENVPYYRQLFKEQKLSPHDIRTIEDLEKIPVLTKEIIKGRWDEFKPAGLSSMKYDTRATGGSTGTPLQYRVSNYDRFLNGALLYRGWGYGGYNLGDRMVFLAGSSLDVGTKPWLVERIHEIARNIRKLSSFDMAHAEMRQYASVMNSFKPRFMMGYASSIYFFANWAMENRVAVPQLEGVFTTAEKLYPNMRETIGEVFRCGVYDTYGLNDGGVTAFECTEHSGLHIDSDRSIMEVVDADHHQLDEGQGEILATSLYNFAMPFIRYSTDDLATLGDAECSCGRHTQMLDELVGRSVDFLVTPGGKHVHGWFFLYIFWKYCKGIKEYQIVQNSIENIEIKLVLEDGFEVEQLNKIKEIISLKSPSWKLQFHFVDKIERTMAGKYKFIINEMERK